MAFTIAFAGKGGTGKTTTAALTVRSLRGLGARTVLAVDADPNSTLHEALGVEVERSIGEITEEMMRSPESTPAPMDHQTGEQPEGRGSRRGRGGSESHGREGRGKF